MILTCPKCSNRYLVDPAKLGEDGRKVRCASCSHSWFAMPPDDAPINVVIEDAPLDDRPLAAAEPRRPVGGRVGGWLAAALIVVLLGALIVGRDAVVARVPQTVSLYRAIGFDVTLQLGLEFRDVTSQRLTEGSVSVLVVAGAIVNVSDQDRDVPALRIALLDDERREVDVKVFRTTARYLTSGGTASFEARVVAPPDGASNFTLTFDVGT